MADGVRLSAAVVYVRNLDKSVGFYRDVLGLEVIDSTATAALLGSDAGAQLVLRAAGENAPHALGAVGVQYLVWSLGSRAELDSRTELLRRLSAFREERNIGDIATVEGRDPDDLVVILTHRPDEHQGLRELPTRIYAW